MPELTPGILSAAVGAAACAGLPTSPPSPPPSSEDRYRFYQCVFEPLHIACKPIAATQIHEGIPGKTTQIQAIANWVPSIADRAIIRWRFFEKRRLDFDHE
jgi:hypothetical protein